MRGVVQQGVRKVSVVDLPRPEVEPATAIVRVRACGVCGSDLHLYRHRTELQERPAGHEIVGEVVEVAPAPEQPARVRVGDLVAVDPVLSQSCQVCRFCLEGFPFHCQQKRRGPDWFGGFAEYTKRGVRGLFPLPAHLTVDHGALVEPLAVAVHGIRLAGLQAGESVAVLGAGTIGLTSLLAARGLGAGKVFITARHPHQAALARELGATAVLPDSPAEAERIVREQTGGAGVDLVVESVGGAAATLNEACTLVRRRGRVAVLGVFDGEVPVDLRTPLLKEATLFFPVCYGTMDGRDDFEVAVDLIASGRAPVTRLITHRFPLEEAPRAFATADDKSTRSVKVLVNP